MESCNCGIKKILIERLRFLLRTGLGNRSIDFRRIIRKAVIANISEYWLFFLNLHLSFPITESRISKNVINFRMIVRETVNANTCIYGNMVGYFIFGIFQNKFACFNKRKDRIGVCTKVSLNYSPTGFVIELFSNLNYSLSYHHLRFSGFLSPFAAVDL